jgi:hypothetical protein
MLALLMPGATYPHSLSELLQLPLTMLLRLEISPQCAQVKPALTNWTEHGR